MRIAARSPSINMVSVDWLWESSQNWWCRIDETPYLITIPNSKPGDLQVDDTAPPSDSNSEVNGKGRGLAISTDADDLLDDEDDDDDIGTAISPVTDMNDNDWELAFQEIQDLPSDEEGEDEEDEHEDEDGEDDWSSTSSKSQQSEKKRKRGDEDHGDDDSSLEGPDSDLQARKRQALARTTSLTHVEVAEGDDVGTNSESAQINQATEGEMIEADMREIFGPKDGDADEDDSDEDEDLEDEP